VAGSVGRGVEGCGLTVGSRGAGRVPGDPGGIIDPQPASASAPPSDTSHFAMLN
jgi:hypothetical protein